MPNPQLRRSSNVLLILAIALLLLQACGSPPPPPPETTVEISLAARKDANASPGQPGRPIVVRLYELKASGSFSTADFFSLYEHAGTVLGADLLGSEEINLLPGQGYRIEKTVTQETAYLGVVAAYRDIDRTQWRDLAPIKAKQVNRVSVIIEADAIRLSAQ
ncbi:type VI secretion system lipoprotein TssJ [Thiohalocapsa marina]|uniref:Type VI secretion system lipoprotein TssJ n=1 Tax=Thiohalocapsa marina TaxID=424902 RepID=A0A5M8FU81_9GAMM|nr:type VI secretion system lipoprotein TssJ [Thiohalocapsa marina]KAA6187356.1 type VI secretion system lipoprotein TssJ [Thiohalocapsa marina]